MMKLKNILLPLLLCLAASCAIAALRPSVPGDMEFFMLRGPVKDVVQYDNDGELQFNIAFDVSGSYLRSGLAPALQKNFGCAEMLVERGDGTYIVSYFFDIRRRVSSVVVSDKSGNLLSTTDYLYRKSERLPYYRTYTLHDGDDVRSMGGTLDFRDFDSFGNWTLCRWKDISVSRSISYY